MHTVCSFIVYLYYLLNTYKYDNIAEVTNTCLTDSLSYK